MKTDEEALELAKEQALSAIEVVLDIMHNGGRNSGTQLAAAKLILEVAGVGALEADARHTELLRELRGKVSEDAWAEVVGALATASGVLGAGTPGHSPTNGNGRH